MKTIGLLSLLFLVMIVTNSCVIEKTGHGLHMYWKAKTTITPAGYVVYKGKFDLKDDSFHLKDTQMLSPTCVYMRKGDSTYTNWFKFYEDGRVLWSIWHKVPQLPADQFGAWGGYYQLKGNDIKIELTYTTQYNLWSTLTLKGKIAGDTLKFYDDGKLHHFAPTRFDKDPSIFYYNKVAIPHLLTKPDF